MGLLMKKHTSTCSLGKGIKPDSDPVFDLTGIFRNSEEHVELSMRQQNQPDGLQGRWLWVFSRKIVREKRIRGGSYKLEDEKKIQKECLNGKTEL